MGTENGSVTARVYYGEDKSSVAGYAMENVEAFIRGGHEYDNGSILEGEKDDDEEICNSYPVYITLLEVLLKDMFEN